MGQDLKAKVAGFSEKGFWEAPSVPDWQKPCTFDIFSLPLALARFLLGKGESLAGPLGDPSRKREAGTTGRKKTTHG
jgi:hypothetical protein